MASNPGQQHPYDRADVHKSCKSLETLLGVLSDYCEAAEAVVILQKKLVKALRESAGLKTTTDIAANTLSASANIFEALFDIDAKFAKIADKEYEGISSEVRKWFKKLAKEEKACDDRIAAANDKIKQAGQVYEKKSKKSARDASDEHARYITLISALAPEISQDKYNHALFVTQRHTSTTFSVAACMSRIADAEWLRACEGVRRYAPAVGLLGEWRALCEGGWGGPIPPDLPDLGAPAQQQPRTQPPPPPSQTIREPVNRISDEERPSPPMCLQAEAIDVNSQKPTEVHPGVRTVYEKEREQPSPLSSPNQPQYPQTPEGTATQKQNQSTPPSSFDNPIRSFLDPNTGSVRSLSAFPAPPTHFPLPPINSQRQQQPSLEQSSHSSSASHISFPTLSRPSDVIPGGDEIITGETVSSSPVSGPPSPQQKFNDNSDINNQSNVSAPGGHNHGLRHSTPMRSLTAPTLDDPSATVAERSPNSLNTSRLLSYDEREFGSDYKPPTRGLDSVKGKGVDRNNTAKNSGSIVAAMRNRYSYDYGASSPPSRDIPRLPMSVTDLATRYQPSDGPSSPRVRASSPPIARTLPSLGTFSQAQQVEASFRGRSPPRAFRESSTIPTAIPIPQPPQPNFQIHATALDDALRRQRRLEELEIKEKEQTLRARELEIEFKSQELERQRDFLMSNDANSLAPPASTRTLRSSSEENSYPERSGQSLNQLHPAHCTCDTCKNSKSGSIPTRPGEKSKGGWMRRLSMPIVAGNAFLDAKRYGGSMKGGLTSLDSKKNA
ncbi:uncharacterized protein BT62DRAFT_926854, partial [Guyanagaster necrorhizus]